MKPIIATVEFIVRMVIFAAMLTAIAGHGHGQRKLAKARVRLGR